MELLSFIGLFIISIAVLLKGSDWFVDAAERIGLSLGISPFIIGVTIIAFGTSLPELAASIAAVMDGESQIVVGNVIGSNIANILLVLGLVAIVANEVKLKYRVMDIDIPLLVVSALLLWFVLQDLHVSTFEAILFLVALAVFLYNSIEGDEKIKKEDRLKAGWRAYGLLALGGVLVYLGAHYTVVAIEELSTILGIGSEVIALTLVALGTSLPEVVVSITAARRGNTSLAMGNVLGSNIFNTYAVMGIPALMGPLTIPASVVEFSLPLMVGATLLLAIIAVTNRISKWEGVMLFLVYCYFIFETAKGAF